MQELLGLLLLSDEIGSATKPLYLRFHRSRNRPVAPNRDAPSKGRHATGTRVFSPRIAAGYAERTRPSNVGAQTWSRNFSRRAAHSTSSRWAKRAARRSHSAGSSQTRRSEIGYPCRRSIRLGNRGPRRNEVGSVRRRTRKDSMRGALL